MWRRLPSDETPDDDSGTKRLRSSTGGVSFKLLETEKKLFCLDITEVYCLINMIPKCYNNIGSRI